jgi:hypothetical protein
MPDTDRFIMIRRGIHVGVLDTERNKVLELVTRDRRRVVIQEIHVQDFGNYIKDEPANAVDDDEKILGRWQMVMKDYERSVKENKAWAYDAGGEYHKDKLNCEILAEWVITGIPQAPLGIWAVRCNKWFGINVTLGTSRRPSSFDSSWFS